ncbi:hypothetical protein LJB42_001504 [Komagataella kurtzmanii]|nr:hypothetical protein LJB42_001504 [Komagataella kurtzmanii]
MSYSKPQIQETEDSAHSIEKPFLGSSNQEPDFSAIEEELPEINNWLAKVRYEYRDYLAEFIGTLVLVGFGDGVVAQKVTSGGTAGNYTTIVLSWGIAVTFGFMASGGVSGGHLNPAVTLCAAIFRGFPWRKVPGYMFSQMLGGFMGAFVVYGTYIQAIAHFEGGTQRTVFGEKATAGIFCTYAQPYLHTKHQVVSELVASAFLQFGIFSLTDTSNVSSSPFWFPFGLFLLIVGIGSSFGYQTGYAINAARDLAPRIASRALGYGPETFTAYHNYAWVPAVIPFIGCILGGFLYDLFVFTGSVSPLNKPYFGFGKFFNKKSKAPTIA